MLPFYYRFLCKLLFSAKLVSNCAFELIHTTYETINSLNIEEDEDCTLKSILSDPNIASLLDLMLLSNTEWQELETKCDSSVMQFDWLNSNTLFNHQNCNLIENQLIAQNNCIPFVYSAVSTCYLLERLIKENPCNEPTNELVEVIASQFKHLFMASAYVSSKSKLLKYKDIETVFSILKKLLLNIMLLTKNQNLNIRIRESLLEKLV